jgi:hypothetical protein
MKVALLLFALAPAAVGAVVVAKNAHGTTRLVAVVISIVLVPFLLFCGAWLRRHAHEDMER